MATKAQEILATNMRRFRAARQWSQEALAEASGLHRTYIGAVERCERNPSVKSIERIAQALDVATWRLLAPGDEVSPESKFTSADAPNLASATTNEGE